MLCLIKEAQQLEIVVIKDFPQTSQQFSFFPYCKADFLKILLKEMLFKFWKHYIGNLFNMIVFAQNLEQTS